MGKRNASGLVVVGVEGSQAARSAVLWTVTEAHVRNCNLVIAYLDPNHDRASPSMEENPEDRNASRPHREMVARANARLSGWADAASQHEPSVIVGTLALRGDPGAELIRLSRSAVLLVLGMDAAQRRAAAARGFSENRLRLGAYCTVVVLDAEATATQPLERDGDAKSEG